MPSDRFNVLIAVALEHIRNTDPTDDEYIQDYLRGFEDAIRLAVEAEQRRVN